LKFASITISAVVAALISHTTATAELTSDAQPGDFIRTQAVTKPGTPSIQLLDHIPAPALPGKDSQIATPAPQPAAAQLPAVSQKLRPQSGILAGSDPSAGSSKPGYLQSVQGMDADLRITRVTNSESDGAHGYSKRQSWNLDETMLDVGGKILDATNNYQSIHSLNMSTERHWSHTNANLVFGLKYDPTPIHFVQYDVRKKQETLIKTFSNYTACTMGDYEGSVSVDDKYVVFACTDVSGSKDIISFDIQSKTILATMKAHPDFNWGSFSTSGQYILVENTSLSNLAGGKLMRYDRYLKNPTLLYTAPQHGDMGVDDNGDDVYVMIDWDYIFYVRLSDGAHVNLGFTNRAGNGHVSCRAFKRPGWCYFSSRDQHQRIFAAKIGAVPNAALITDDRGRQVTPGLAVVEHWGFSKASSSRYQNYAKVSVSPTGRKLVFSSDWWQQLNRNIPHPGGGGEAQEYVLELVK